MKSGADGSRMGIRWEMRPISFRNGILDYAGEGYHEAGFLRRHPADLDVKVAFLKESYKALGDLLIGHNPLDTNRARIGPGVTLSHDRRVHVETIADEPLHICWKRASEVTAR